MPARLGFAPLALAALASPALAQPAPTGPALIGELFCLALTGGDVEAIRSALTTDLNAAIDAALERNDAIQAENPDEKPPLGDGVPWSGAPDYAPECTPSIGTETAGAAQVTIRHGFPDEPDADYTDTLHLVTVEGRYGQTLWRIDDIAFDTGADLGFPAGSTLRSALTGAFDG
ncbi:hypothetical protein VE25_16885 [Devosia geojensis]|uniref:DUF3828 domain-containing protein n=1 Tax=Devosia geojensis TaxID=443610 RepID=A0A0F5FR53_9HYPH|nr:hypothetical protein [Devosia geojensis]KKB10647.1 hypothetical protein VE25_16885 [Devosia geojensis]